MQKKTKRKSKIFAGVICLRKRVRDIFVMYSTFHMRRLENYQIKI